MQILLKPYLIFMKLQKGPEYGPQGMTAYDLLRNTRTSQDPSNPWGDLLVMDLLLILFGNNPKPKTTWTEITPI